MKKLIIVSLTTLVATYILPGVEVEGIIPALFFAIILGLLNFTLGNFLKFSGCLINLLTLGLFNLIINTIMVLFADKFIDQMTIHGFLSALLLSVLIAIATSIFDQDSVKHTPKNRM